MQSRVVSFSIRPHDKEADELVEFFKVRSTRLGIKFSFMMLEALKSYKARIEENENGQRISS